MLDIGMFIVLMLIAIFCFFCAIGVWAQDGSRSGEYETVGKIIAFIFFLAIGMALPIFLGFSRCDTGKKIVQWKFGQESKLKKQVAELNKLHNQLQQKQKEVSNLRNDYQSTIDSLEREIKAEKRKNNIRTYEQAQKHSRICYDLSLIRRKQAYITKLDEITERLQSGTLELEFLKRQSEDDLKMVKVMGQEQIEQLANEINGVIEKYLPDAGELVIEVDENSLESPEQIWERINQGR